MKNILLVSAAAAALLAGVSLASAHETRDVINGMWDGGVPLTPKELAARDRCYKEIDKTAKAAAQGKIQPHNQAECEDLEDAARKHVKPSN